MSAVTGLARLFEAFPDAALVEVPEDDLAAHAVAYAAAGWEVFPLRGKAPAIGNPHPPGSPERPKCKGECGLDGHGVHDATTDLTTIARWWTERPRANIGGRVPGGCVVIDIDPRSGGLESWAALVAEHGDIATRRARSGRGDGGEHLYLHHPGGSLSARRLPPGLDLKTHAGYCVLPPSIHPDTGQPYRWVDPAQPIAPMPDWLAQLLRPTEPRRTQPAIGSRDWSTVFGGDSVADWFTESHTWGDVLEPHGWRIVRGDGEQDGSGWCHPRATSPLSATIRHGLLFVYSTNTPFEPTETERPHGYTRFRAWAVLDHGGDLSAAAQAARQLRDRRAA